MKKIRDLVKEHFTLSEKEANGFIILCFFMLLVLAFPWAHSYYLEKQNKPEDLAKTSYFAQNAEAQNQTEKFDQNKHQPSIKLEPFNPNEINPETWIKFGLNRKIAERISKYQSKGGRFKIKSDLLKIYGFPEQLYSKLEPMILLPDRLPTQKAFKAKETKKPALIKINLNEATAEELIKIKGIGVVLSERIIKFRDRLGGFVKKEQIHEVYGLDSIVSKKIQQIGFIDTAFKPKKLMVNTATEEQLTAHPYVNRKSAQLLINFREHHGVYTNTEDILKSKAFKKEQLGKIIPYLQF